VSFQFKQFTIEDNACAMKVGTDSIMLGSWVQANHAQRILDIGTGSGLLAIMLAQKTMNDCHIVGIDIDVTAITQAEKNAEDCPWATKLTFMCSSVQNYSSVALYDLIISNPPYFPINESANKTDSVQNRPNARQTIELDHPTLIQKVTKHLSDDGTFYCVLPADIAKVFITQAELANLYCIRELQVQPTPQTNVTRLLLEFIRTKKAKTCEKLCIYTRQGEYSEEYIALCKDYYLNF
jgi:tRNA1Val (adenine37-N6)-methyltransferase